MTRTVCDICTFAGLFNFQSPNLFIVYKAKIKPLRMSAVFLLDQRKICMWRGNLGNISLSFETCRSNRCTIYVVLYVLYPVLYVSHVAFIEAFIRYFHHTV